MLNRRNLALHVLRPQSFADLTAAAKVVNETVQGMNTYRAELNKLVKLREVDKIKSAQAGEEKHYAPYREKKALAVAIYEIFKCH